MKSFLIIFRFFWLGLELYGCKVNGYTINLKQVLFSFITTPSSICYNMVQLCLMAFNNKPYLNVLNEVGEQQNINSIIRHFIISVVIDCLIIKLIWFN